VPSCRRALRRVAVLALITVLSVVVAWLAWNALLDRRLRLGGSATTTSVSFSLEAMDTTRQLEADLVRASGSAEAAPGPSDTVAGATAAPPASGGGGLEIDGHVLGGLAAGAALGLGAVVGRIVLRRFRDELEQAPQAQATAEDGHRPEHEERAVETASEEEQDEPGGVDEDAPDDLSGALGPAVSADLVTVLDTSARTDAEQAVDRRRETELPDLDDIGQVSGSTPATQAWQGPPQPVYEARERVYERRRAPRVAVRLDGQLHWRGGHWPVTVLDLSDSGLQLTLARRPSAPGRQAPLAAGDHVRVSFEAPPPSWR